ncbi:MAG: cyclic nucleotide-gated ion channel/potassium channel family protein [Xanthobacteraceae bacterium]|nr:cyclic nucleotide-gated ion channel/potassium channel family protein [Xanthobacteraceae bacterium]
MSNPVPTALADFAARTAAGERRGATYAAVAAGLLTMLIPAMTADPDGQKWWVEIVLFLCVVFFCWEWLVRLVHAAQIGRVRSYSLSGQGIIDAAGALAMPLAILTGAEFRSVSLLAIIWLLKPAPHIAGLRQLRRVIVREAAPLASVCFLFLIVLFFAAVLAHVLERDVQPAVFGSVPAAMWWAVVTLTTTGYGDVVPQTVGGRVVAAVLMICGLGVFGLLTGILATGFAAENRRHNFIQTWETLGKVPFFAALSPATLADVTSVLRRVDMRARTTIVRQGQVGDCMYFVAAGEVEVELPNKCVRLGVGSFFGELALLGAKFRTATVMTVTSSTLLVLDLVDFRALMGRHRELAEAIDAEAKRRAQENASSNTVS